MSFQIPSDLTALDSEALEAALDSALTEASEFDSIDTADLSAEQAERIVALAEFVGEAQTVLSQHEDAVDGETVEMARKVLKGGTKAVKRRPGTTPGRRQGRIRQYADAVEEFGEGDDTPQESEEETQASGLTQTPDDQEPGAQEVEVAEQPIPADAEKVPLVKDTKPAQTPAEEGVPADSNLPAPAETDSDPEADVNSKPSAVSRAAGNGPQQQAALRPAPALVAAADVPNVPAGKRFDDLGGIAEVVAGRVAAYPTSFQGRDLHLRHSAAHFEINGRLDQADFRSDEELLNAAASERRLPGGNLVAAGGWDAPSETLYDLCGSETVTGLWRGPEVTIRRGGLRYTKGPTLADVMGSGTGFWNMTEAQVEAGTAKTALRPTEPTFVEQRLDAIGVYVQAGLLTRQGYPELVRRYVELAVKAHAYKKNAKILAALESQIGAAVSLADGYGNATDILHALELLIEGERQRLKLGDNASMEVLLPHWTKAALRADVVNRTGQTDLVYADSVLNAAFTARGAQVQYLYAWQELPYTAGYPTGYPDTLTAIVYPAGTYVVGASPVIQLDTIYDSVLLEENHYIALFMEEGILVANPCGEGKRISVPLRINGRTGSANITNNLYNAAV